MIEFRSAILKFQTQPDARFYIYDSVQHSHSAPPPPKTYFRNSPYVVWQKNNETDFILILNLILFTNQGYPLQNSSLGQLHSDGGVVSAVPSSAFSSSVTLFWILSKVPKWRPFKWFLSRGNKKKSQGLRSGEYEGWRTTGMLFSAKNSLMENAVWYGALSWCSIQVRAMPGSTRAALFLSLSRTSR